MENENNLLSIPIGMRIPIEYLDDLNDAIVELQLLVFERRELDLQESQCYALYILTDFQRTIAQLRSKEK